jgi:hypothetical protein
MRSHEASTRLVQALEAYKIERRSRSAANGARGAQVPKAAQRGVRVLSPRKQDGDLRANHPSSSSLRVGAGSGAPGFVSVIGSLT